MSKPSDEVDETSKMRQEDPAMVWVVATDHTCAGMF
jgi:hypothetical protein